MKELIWNLHYTDEDQKSETIVCSFQVMEKILIQFEKKKPYILYNETLLKKTFHYNKDSLKYIHKAVFLKPLY